ncbi:lysophospholipid acyltransferase family protein [Lacinutrix sp. 5H-3-7-4]|uniref:lysophospholipid acyltransferase family protein n=1 Tax=Lacinutrix sp. (strain 5H-3-7-4) TaxID=983544 RepID=UPI00020A3B9F|nr:lysophospholipid acyltransferase family protein [Lacinutrix sp. 5H-3-7-4]AEH02668.1 lipid A biosynthesis acyltransferase [Lacinutrix sp. 5H-3-7-4]
MQFLVYILIYPFFWIISILPFKLLYAFSDFLYLFIYRIFGYRKKVVINNLQLVFPEKSSEEINTITKKFYHHLCDMIVESMKSMTISEAEMKKRYTFTNVEVIKKLEKENRDIIIMCGHYASWEWIFILQTYVSHKGFGVYKRLGNKYFDRLIKRIRARYNSHLITTKETIQTLKDVKASGELSITGFVADQSPKPDKAHHWNEFMGVMAPIHTGAEMLAKRLDMAVVFFDVRKVGRGYYQTTFKTIAENPNTFDNYEITDIFKNYVEQQVKEEPEYYLWTHKRWKHRDKVPKKFL